MSFSPFPECKIAPERTKSCVLFKVSDYLLLPSSASRRRLGPRAGSAVADAFFIYFSSGACVCRLDQEHRHKAASPDLELDLESMHSCMTMHFHKNMRCHSIDITNASHQPLPTSAQIGKIVLYISHILWWNSICVFSFCYLMEYVAYI